MKTQMPLFRAKKIDSDEYVFGSYFKDKSIHSIITHSRTDYADKAFYVNAVQINETTIAIHFPDMLDSEGTRIFASLSEDGRGGDILYSKTYSTNLIIVYQRYTVAILDYNKRCWVRSNIVSEDIKVTGIQQ